MRTAFQKGLWGMVVLVSLTTVWGQPGQKGGVKKENAIVESALREIEDRSIREKVKVIFQENFPEFLDEIGEMAKADGRDEMMEFVHEQFRECAERVREFYRMEEEEMAEEGGRERRRRDITKNKGFKQWLAYKKIEYSNMILGRKIQAMIRSKKTDKTKTALLEKQLRQGLDTMFELRMKQEAAEIKEMENELEHLRTMHRKRVEKKNQVIEKRFNELIGNEAIYDW